MRGESLPREIIATEMVEELFFIEYNWYYEEQFLQFGSRDSDDDRIIDFTDLPKSPISSFWWNVQPSSRLPNEEGDISEVCRFLEGIPFEKD